MPYTGKPLEYRLHCIRKARLRDGGAGERIVGVLAPGGMELKLKILITSIVDLKKSQHQTFRKFEQNVQRFGRITDCVNS